MANTNARPISNLTACNAPIGNNLLAIVGNTAGTKNTFSLSISNLFGNSQANVIVANSFFLRANTATITTISSNTVVITGSFTPGSNTDLAANGRIWFDANYLYVAVGTNDIRRVPLQTFE